MLKRSYKLIICVVLVTTLFVFSYFPAFAIGEEILVAGAIEGALAASGIGISVDGISALNSNVIWQDDVLKLTNSEKDTWYQAIQDGQVRWVTNALIIDGISYDKVTLDNGLSSSLNYFTTRIIEDYELEDGSTGTLFQYSGYVDSSGTIFPLVYSYYNYTIGPSAILQRNSSLVIGTGPGRTEFTVGNSTSGQVDIYYLNNQIFSQNNLSFGYLPRDVVPIYAINRNNGRTYVGYKYGSDSYFSRFAETGVVISDTTNLTIFYDVDELDSVLPVGYGYYYYVPSSLRPIGVTEDGIYTDSSVVEDTINSITTGAGEDNIILSGKEDFDNPLPPPPPVPDTTIADTSYSTLHDELIDIKNHQAHSGSVLENIDSGVDVIGRSVDNIDQTLTDIEGYVEQGTADIVDSVDTAGQAVVDGLSDVEGAIDTAGQSVVSELGRLRTIFDTIGQSVISLLQGIRTAIGTVVTTITDAVADITDAIDGLAEQVLEDIETAPINVFSTALDVIKLAFAPIIAALKACIGLWHYVVEWVQVTAPVFSTFFGLMSGTSYNMVLPIYAALAGPIVIAIYKRFGK